MHSFGSQTFYKPQVYFGYHTLSAEPDLPELVLTTGGPLTVQPVSITPFSHCGHLTFYHQTLLIRVVRALVVVRACSILVPQMSLGRCEASPQKSPVDHTGLQLTPGFPITGTCVFVDHHRSSSSRILCVVSCVRASTPACHSTWLPSLVSKALSNGHHDRFTSGEDREIA